MAVQPPLQRLRRELKRKALPVIREETPPPPQRARAVVWPPPPDPSWEGKKLADFQECTAAIHRYAYGGPAPCREVEKMWAEHFAATPQGRERAGFMHGTACFRIPAVVHN